MAAPVKESPAVTSPHVQEKFVSPAEWALNALAEPGQPLPEVRVQFAPSSSEQLPTPSQEHPSERQLRHSA